MNLRSKFSKIVIIVVFLFVALIISIIYLDLDLNLEGDFFGEGSEESDHQIIFSEGDVYTSEGTTIPEDIDFRAILPEFPPTAELQKVIDSKNPNSRIVSFRFRLLREEDEFRNQLKVGLEERNWKGILEKENGTLIAKREKIFVTIEFDQIDKLDLLVLVSIEVKN